MINEYGEKVKIIYDDKIKVEIIESNSNITDEMISNIDEIVYILEGMAILKIENKEIKLKKSMKYLIKKIQNIKLYILAKIVNGYVYI